MILWFEPNSDCVKTIYNLRKLLLLFRFSRHNVRVFKYKKQFPKLNLSFHTASIGFKSRPVHTGRRNVCCGLFFIVFLNRLLIFHFLDPSPFGHKSLRTRHSCFLFLGLIGKFLSVKLYVSNYECQNQS